MGNPKVSIIVPVFNVQTYLRECLDSILNQTLTDIEIICGDGGSNDGSLEIIQEYAQKDARVKYITKEGSGYGQSMNECMDMAKGEYIGIVESDDAVEPNTYEVLYSLAKENDVDWIRGDIYFYYSGMPKEEQLKRESIIYGGDFYNIVLNPQTDYRPYKSGLRTWSGIYKTEFLNKNGIRHHETPGGSYQDVGFYLKTLYYAERVYFVDQAFYKWRQDNPGSSVHYNSAKLVEKSLKEWKLNREYLDNHPGIGKRAIASYHYRKFFSYLWTMDMAVGEDKEIVRKIALEEFSKALSDGEIDRGFFSDWEWERFLTALQSWKEGDTVEEQLPQEKTTVKSAIKRRLRPLAGFMRRIVYKLMRDVLFSIENDNRLLANQINQVEEKLGTLSADQERMQRIEDKLNLIMIDSEKKAEERLNPLMKEAEERLNLLMKEVEEQKAMMQQFMQQNEMFIDTKLQDLYKKQQENGDMLWNVKCRGEDIHDKVATIQQKVLDQGDVLWSTRDKLRDIEIFVKKNADAQAWNLLYELKREDLEKLLSSSPVYDSAFYMNNRYGSVSSAQHILSVMFELLPHDSVVDFGCGTGTWLWVAKALGAKKILGIDGDYVPRSLLMIPEDTFRAADLQEDIQLEQKFDLAMSLEVAEHLDEKYADVFVNSLCRSADTILFSAAHPGQGGDGHLNEQPAEYWIEKFVSHGFVYEEIKDKFEGNDKIEFWYRDNIMLFRKQS